MPAPCTALTWRARFNADFGGSFLFLLGCMAFFLDAHIRPKVAGGDLEAGLSEGAAGSIALPELL